MTPERVVVVGGGVLGTLHAWIAVDRGSEVVHLEADAEPRAATVRNFGMVWVSGRAPGAELEAARQARRAWDEIARMVPDIGFRPDGSLTVVVDDAHRAVLEEVCARDDADERGVELLDPAAARKRNPCLGGELAAALWCVHDAVVEPRRVLPALRRHLGGPAGGARYRWCPGRTVTAISTGEVRDHTGERHGADLVIVCPGARSDGPIAELLSHAPLRRVRLLMASTAPLGCRMPTMLADQDSLRYYPAFDVPAARRLPPADPLVERHRLQLLVSQRADGTLTIGDTHDDTEPFPVGLDEAPYEHLHRRLCALMGRAAPPIEQRWAGVYSQCLDPNLLCWRDWVADDLVVVTGPGGRGMTLAPVIAEQTWGEIA
jgi:FAD dependent oxidoreductase TIGR03364